MSIGSGSAKWDWERRGVGSAMCMNLSLSGRAMGDEDALLQEKKMLLVQ